MAMMRMDPFREFDRLSQQLLRGTLARPVSFPMDAWKEGDDFVVEFDIPGIDPADVELDIERNVLTVRAERKSRIGEDVEVIAEERPQGSFSRQIMLSDNLDPEAAKATYESGVLTVRIPVVEKKDSHRIEITGSYRPKEIDT